MLHTEPSTVLCFVRRRRWAGDRNDKLQIRFSRQRSRVIALQAQLVYDVSPAADEVSQGDSPSDFEFFGVHVPILVKGAPHIEYATSLASGVASSANCTHPSRVGSGNINKY